MTELSHVTDEDSGTMNPKRVLPIRCQASSQNEGPWHVNPPAYGGQTTVADMGSRAKCNTSGTKLGKVKENPPIPNSWKNWEGVFLGNHVQALTALPLHLFCSPDISASPRRVNLSGKHGCRRRQWTVITQFLSEEVAFWYSSKWSFT